MFDEDRTSTMVEEGVDSFATAQLLMTMVPSGGLEGVIQYPLFVSSSGASEYTQGFI